MSKNTDKLLEGDQLQDINQFGKTTPVLLTQPVHAHDQPPLAEGESYTISDKPNKLVCTIFNSLHFFENENFSVVGKIYILVATLLLTVIFWLKQEFLSELPAIEVLFVAFLTTFIFNYYLINGALYKPFIENEQNSHLIKLSGGFAVAAIASFFYGLKFINLPSALTIFYSAFFLVVVFEVVFLKETYKSSEILLALGALVGVIITISGSSGTFWDQITTKDEEANFLYGVILSATSAVLMAMIMINFGKMHSENFATLNHIFTMMIVLFTPIFFPIQGVVTPNFNQWILLIVIGIFTAIATLFFIRSFQLETGGRSAVFILLQVAFVFVIEWLVSNASGFSGIIGAAITIACVGLYSKESPKKIFVQRNEHHEKEQEMVNIH